ncbi:MAG: hypothetical protein F4Y60_13675 [Boseongicola sp. SB0664_bin_43]|uniref:Secreted protein n=1 Tax=Boseongicola sp. SB0664_bin_43 TaxID=2604844 RepID=A0A6B0Y2V8_9RHOB|nr:hypothetical protein [Boseongicola sp. SB0664_bin_43]MYK30195.1 hypothetical protein [Boseongicola sp. SB0670_bin_30]
MNHSILACAFLVMSPTPALADEANDIAVAESLLMARKIGSDAADAAMNRANAAMLSVLSTSPDRDLVLRGWEGVKECFRKSCATDRSLKPGHRFFKSDERLTSEGCLTRLESVEAKCEGSRGNCFEPVPENIGQVADNRVVRCLTNDTWVESFRDRLYDIFVDDEIERRLAPLEPDVKKAVQSQLGLVDT